MRLLPFLPAILLLALPVAARADHNPDFDDDAKPILRMQPGLLEYVQSHFTVKDTGTAKYPGTDSRPPQPPFMFPARARGESGPYHLMLLIQPGPVNRILKVVDMNRVHLNQATPAASTPVPAVVPPPVTSSTAPAPVVNAPAPTPATNAPAPSQTPTADTPTGPIQSGSAPQTPPADAPSLTPPPDSPPPAH